MRKVYILSVVILTFLISIIIGLINYRNDKKKPYSFFGMFPFELKSERNSIFNLIFRIVLALSISAMAGDALYLLIYNISSIFLTKSLGIFLIITSIILISLFIIDFKSLNNHLLGSSIFITLVFIDYALFGYIALVNVNDLFFTYQGIVSLVIAFILLLFMVYPPLVNWYKNKKVNKKDSEESEYQRKKVNLLALFEWSSIFLFVLLFVLITLSNIA